MAEDPRAVGVDRRWGQCNRLFVRVKMSTQPGCPNSQQLTARSFRPVLFLKAFVGYWHCIVGYCRPLYIGIFSGCKDQVVNRLASNKSYPVSRKNSKAARRPVRHGDGFKRNNDMEKTDLWILAASGEQNPQMSQIFMPSLVGSGLGIRMSAHTRSHWIVCALAEILPRVSLKNMVNLARWAAWQKWSACPCSGMHVPLAGLNQ